MYIEQITKDKLRTMQEKEGLIIQGCGGNLNEWVDGINDLLTEEKILLDGSKFENCLSFQNEGITCILFPFDDVKLDMDKLAIWRLKSHSAFNGTWLTDYVENSLGGFIQANQDQKPNCELIGQDGNIFNLMGIASRTLRENGMKEQASEMCSRIRASSSYYEALNIIGEYVNIIGPDEGLDEEENDMEMEEM